MCLGENIRYLRIKNGYSQEYIAEKLGYKSFTTIQKWESGISEPPVKKLKELSILLGADMDDMNNKRLSISNASEDKEIVQKSLPKIFEYYNSLNDIGKHEATKRVQELTFIPQYQNNTSSAIAAHNEHIDADELEKIKIDIANLKRPD